MKIPEAYFGPRQVAGHIAKIDFTNNFDNKLHQ